ncbi:class I SAM-dependent methyltransferase [Acetobacter sacchari]|uniref:S-adenosyl-L-methionine-dependent methyltransferase n=1 Tax=Acetobacter sacchari TaxID=2661687 RepID=A0ABS3LTU8_9PROT|nr:class I SAM-dependent methyltransferase [Acetobacter sacchari]
MNQRGEPESPSEAPDLWRSTAVGVARLRAEHQIIDGGSIFLDPLAVPILGPAAPDPEELAQSDEHLRRGAIRRFIAARSRIANDVIDQRATRDGLGQAVILGAGLDTFGLRNPYPDLTTFELDRAAMQDFKRRRIVEAEIQIPATLRFVEADFERKTLPAILAESGFDPAEPTVFVWLGVAIYLTRGSISATLDVVAKTPRSTIVFDYSEPLENYPPQAQKFLTGWSENVKTRGEPWRSRFQPSEMHALLAERGFAQTIDYNKGGLARRFGTEPPAPGEEAGAHVVVASTAAPADSKGIQIGPVAAR